MLSAPPAAAKPKTPPAAAVLAWYDVHRRALPWRARPGEVPDPYRVWLSEVMLQQTTVPAVKAYYEKFLALWPTLADLAAAGDEAVMAAWAGLGYYSRARNLLACARRVVADHGGRFPADEAALRKLPGIGDYTAAAIAAIAFGRRAVVVDANVERVMARHAAITEPLPGAKAAIRAATDALTPDARAGDFAQAMMDLGATICTPRRPACALCPLSEGCLAFRQGIAEALPVKAGKKVRPVRRGAAFVLRDGAGRLLVRTRPPKGLLGGMTEVPGTEWLENVGLPIHPAGAPLAAEYHRKGSITHVFTHFALELAVFAAEVGEQTPPPPGMRWILDDEIAGAAFPTLFRKVVAKAA
jgi:A/G-specific adenine glycosylase